MNKELKDWIVIFAWSAMCYVSADLAGWGIEYPMGIFMGMACFKAYDRYLR